MNKMTRGILTSGSFPYNVIFDELLVAQENLLPAQDGHLRPGVEGSRARVHSCKHLLLGSHRDTSHHLIRCLRSKRQFIPDKLTKSRGLGIIACASIY